MEGYGKPLSLEGKKGSKTTQVFESFEHSFKGSYLDLLRIEKPPLAFTQGRGRRVSALLLLHFQKETMLVLLTCNSTNYG